MQRFNLLPDVIKNLIIINGLFFLGTMALGNAFGLPLIHYLGLHLPGSPGFAPYQLVTHLFMHADFGHFFFNMFALWMFGYTLENIWGAKRFLNYYLITGFGAALLHFGVQYYEYQIAIEGFSPEMINLIKTEGFDVIVNRQNYTNPQLAAGNALLNQPTVGASGAVFGILLAFGMLFPNQPIFFIFLPIPIKAKYFVAGYGLLELINGFTSTGNVAHFAHLGGMLFGFLVLRYWKSKYGTYH